MSILDFSPTTTRKFVVIISIQNPSLNDYDIDEMDGLVQTAGYKICSHLTQRVNHLNAGFFMGKGKATAVRTYLETFFGEKGRRVNPVDAYPKTTFDEISSAWPNLPTEDEQIEDNPDFNDKNADKEGTIESEIGPGDIQPLDIEAVDLFLPRALEDNRDLTIIFNNRLGSMQILNLEKYWKVRVIDRDAVILEIFQQNAKTREAQLQIELAQLGLQTSRLKKEWGQAFGERQTANVGKGKGIPGWQPMVMSFQTRRKKILDELELIRHNRTNRRRTRSTFFNVGVMGYTGAGKTTLLNTLAKERLETASSPFTTVTTTSRKIVLPWFDEHGGFHREEMIVTDSVGFVYDISPQFVQAFLSTLEEMIFSDLILIVIDIADAKFERLQKKIETTFKVIQQIGAAQIPKIIVFNKADMLPEEEIKERTAIAQTYFADIPSVLISAKNKTGLDELSLQLRNSKNLLFESAKNQKERLFQAEKKPRKKPD